MMKPRKTVLRQVPPTFRPLDPSTQDWNLAQQLRDTLRIRRYIKNVEITDLLAKLNVLEDLNGMELTR